MNLKMWQVDAFAEKPLEGNPAAIIPLERFVDAGLMQKIANENNLAETAFLVWKAPGQYDLRWFTPESEVDLCGHATLASAWLIFEELDPELKQVCFDTRSGALIVDRSRDGRHVMSLPSDIIAPFDAPPGLRSRSPMRSAPLRRRNFIAAAISSVFGRVPTACAALRLLAISAACCVPPTAGALSRPRPAMRATISCRVSSRRPRVCRKIR
jgi:hypothetical protein